MKIPDDKAGPGSNDNPSNTSTTVYIVPPSGLTGFVLSGLHGSKRLQSACLSLAQIDVVMYEDGDSFFEEIDL